MARGWLSAGKVCSPAHGQAHPRGAPCARARTVDERIVRFQGVRDELGEGARRVRIPLQTTF